MPKQSTGGTTGNQALSNAKSAKQDEFYTQLSDIENELRHYREQLRGKVVLCNCDDPYESNFFRYFALNFNALGLKKLITTCYDGSSIAGGRLPLLDIEGLKPEGKQPYAVEITNVPDANGDGAIDLTDVELLLKTDGNVSHTLKGDAEYGAGDFRSAECIEFLKQADVVVTNPPFSLFNEYVDQLFDANKNFIIIGNKNAVSHAHIYSLFMKNRIWVGMTSMSKDLLFDVPRHIAKSLVKNGKEGSTYRIIDGVVKGRSSSIWYTNLPVPKRNEHLPLFRRYNTNDYPKFDFYDVINVNATADIPVDYDGAMGVPISFLDRYSPSQFEIINCNEFRTSEKVPLKKHGLIKDKDAAIGGKPTYVRVVIRRLGI